jgi:hypothetical protein
MPRGNVKPRERDLRRTLRSLRKEGVPVDCIQVDAATGNFTVVIARTDTPHGREVNLDREVEDLLAAEKKKWDDAYGKDAA